jgi:RNA-directed DNA polymerase
MLTLIQKVARVQRLKKAWKLIRHRATSKGYDRVTIADFKENLTSNLEEIKSELQSGNYEFGMLRGFAASKGPSNNSEKKKIRPIRIPAVRDRVAQKAIQLVIGPELNKKYKIDNPVSFAYIKEKSVVDAISQVRKLYTSGHRWVYVADIQSFFDTISPTTLLKDYIFPAISDRTLDALISDSLITEIGNMEQMVKMGYGRDFMSDEIGIAQGGILSPLFANVYLHKLDKAMIDNNFRMVRYADDFVVMCVSEAEAKRAHEIAKTILCDDLGLKLHEIGSKKSSIKRFTHLEFLGVRFEGKNIFPGSNAMSKMVSVLRDFQRKPIKTTLVENLVFLRDRPSSWAATYFYTNLDHSCYATLDGELLKSVESLLNRFGFMPRNGKFVLDQMRRLGMPTFTDRLVTIRKNKKKEIDKFYGIDQ